MPPVPIFCNGTYQAISPNIDAELAINVFCEQSESPGAKTPIALIMAPGKFLFSQLPEAGVSCLFPVNGRLFAAGASLWEIFADGTNIARGSMGLQPTSPCQIQANETQLLAMNNGNLYTLDLASNAFAAVNMAQFVGGAGSVAQIGFSDGYFIATQRNSHTFQQSDLEDGSTWNGLNISTVSLFPDNFMSMICDHREVWFFSGKKTAAYYNAGSGFPVFIPIQGAFMEFGAAAAFATVQLDNSIFWIDQDERGFAVARKAVGYNNQRVSTHAVEFAWSQYSRIDDAIAYSYQEQGHTFWVIRFPTGNATWVLDVSTGLWHQRGFYNTTNGTYEADHSQSHAFNFNKHLVGDWASGNIYIQNTQLYTDNGNPIRWIRRSPTTNVENHWVYFSELEIDIEPGLGPQPPLLDGAGQPRPPQIMLRWSNDGAKTWSSTYLLGCGQAGEYNARARKMQLGRARRRVWEIAANDPIPWRIANAYMQAAPSLE